MGLNEVRDCCDWAGERLGFRNEGKASLFALGWDWVGVIGPGGGLVWSTVCFGCSMLEGGFVLVGVPQKVIIFYWHDRWVGTLFPKIIGTGYYFGRIKLYFFGVIGGQSNWSNKPSPIILV